MTLKEMYIEVARRVEEDIVIKDNQKISDSTQAILDKFLISINYAYRKIALDKRLFLTKETVALENNRVNTDYLNEEFCEILKVTDSEGNNLKYFMEDGDNEILVEGTGLTDVTVYYYYLPRRLEEMTDEPQFPADVDDMILCFFAAYDYLAQEGDEETKAQNQLILYNDKYDGIRRRRGRTKYVRQ
jgi:hypothetical protein